MRYFIFAVTILVCFTPGWANSNEEIKALLSDIEYPDRFEIVFHPEGTIPVIVKDDTNVSINIVPENTPVSFSGTGISRIKDQKIMYFKVSNGVVTMYYADNQSSFSKNITESAYTTDDGQTIRHLKNRDISANTLKPLRFIYLKEKSLFYKISGKDNRFILQRSEPSISDMFDILKKGEDLDTVQGKSGVIKRIALGGLYGYSLPESYTEILDSTCTTTTETTSTDTGKGSVYAVCSRDVMDKPKITLNFKDVPLRDAIISLCSQTGINIIIQRDIDQNMAISAFYDGLSVDDALRSIISGLDLSYKKEGNIYTLTPFEERMFDINKILTTPGGSIQSQQTSSSPSPLSQPQISGPAGGQLSASQSTQQAVSSHTDSTSLSPSGSDEGVNAIISSIKSILSPKGTVIYIPSGFIYVKDSPSRIKSVEQLLDMDTAKRQEINLKVTLMRIDYKKEFETGIDWSAVVGGVKGGVAEKIDVGSKFLGGLAGNVNVSAVKFTTSKDTLSAVIKALSAYGDVSIIHTWETRAMAGTTLPFELTQDVWYNQGTVVQVVNNQTITSQQVGKESVGVKLLINPVLHQDNRYIVNTWVELSNVVGFQKVGEQELPMTEKNFTRIPIKMGRTDTAIISGFKIKNKDSSSEGIPFLARLPVLKYIFGHTKTADRTSELSVMITIQ